MEKVMTDVGDLLTDKVKQLMDHSKEEDQPMDSGTITQEVTR